MQSLLRDAHAESVWGSFELNVDARQLAQTDARRPFELAKAPSGASFCQANVRSGGNTVEIGFREFLIPAFLWALYLVVALIRACINPSARENGQAAADVAAAERKF